MFIASRMFNYQQIVQLSPLTSIKGFLLTNAIHKTTFNE
jgi:hypothetical protein